MINLTLTQDESEYILEGLDVLIEKVEYSQDEINPYADDEFLFVNLDYKTFVTLNKCRDKIVSSINPK